jgi:hypothetical protein
MFPRKRKVKKIGSSLDCLVLPEDKGTAPSPSPTHTQQTAADKCGLQKKPKGSSKADALSAQ